MIAVFMAPWLLLGLAAAGIPIVLHLLSSVRAQEVPFPTLRFLHISMEKTARRRRLENWLLLLVRTLLFALLALAVSEPVLRAASGMWSDKRFAAVLIVDNSYSMAAKAAGGTTRFEIARREAGKLLGGANKPTLAALLLTNSARADAGTAKELDLAGDLDGLRKTLADARLASGRASLPEPIGRAIDLLKKQAVAQKVVYVFTDMQKLSFDGLGELRQLRDAGIQLLVVDCSGGRPADNVGIADVQVTGKRIADQTLELSATLVNSSPADRVVEVWLQLDGRPAGDPVSKPLKAAGKAEDRGTVRFFQRFTTPGSHFGQVAVSDSDDLAADNVRRFALDISPRVPAVLVRGDGPQGGAFDSAAMLHMALDPYAGAAAPWSIQLQTVPASQFGDATLNAAQVAFFADVPTFTPVQAVAVERFVRRGGSAVFFVGPAVSAANYNDVFVQKIPAFGGLLPGRLDKAVGQVGLTAQAVKAVKNLRHPYLAGLFETAGDYPEVLVQRYYRLAGVAPAEAVLSAPGGDAIVSAKDFGAGRVILFATTASVEWNNLATTPLLLPMVTRICLEAGARLGADQTYAEGAPVTIRPRMALPGRSAVNVTLPDGTIEVLPLVAAAPSTAPAGAGGPSVVFAKTQQSGLYHWQVAGTDASAEGARGAFAVNPDGAEFDLARMEPRAVARIVDPGAAEADLEKGNLHFGATLEEVQAAATAAAAGDNLWDRFLVAVILLLVVEAVLANRFRPGAEPALAPGKA